MAYATTTQLSAEAAARKAADAALAARVSALEAYVAQLRAHFGDPAFFAPNPPGSGNTTTVSSIPTLLSALADDSLDTIIVSNGTYDVSGATAGHADSLYIGSAYASRTRPVTVQAQTTGSVTFHHNNSGYACLLIFTGGAHHQTWQGFHFAGNTTETTQTGVVYMGNTNSTLSAGPHHITLKDITLDNTLMGAAVTNPPNDHAFYITDSSGGVHDILIDGLTVNLHSTKPLHTVAHLYNHGWAGSTGSYNVTFQNVTVNAPGTYGCLNTVMLWDGVSNHDLLFKNWTSSKARYRGADYHYTASAVTFDNFDCTASGEYGFYGDVGGVYTASGGASAPAGGPAGFSFINGCSFA